jgi:uncharacterized protein YidB (DUF937 family)
MGMLDQLLEAALRGGGAEGVNRSQASGLAQALVSLLNDPRTGGIDGLMRQFQQSGLGDAFTSWVGTGQNQAVSPAEVSRALGRERLDQLSQQAGLSQQEVPSILAQLLPVLIDQLTPHGRVPERGQLDQASTTLLKSLLG